MYVPVDRQLYTQQEVGIFLQSFNKNILCTEIVCNATCTCIYGLYNVKLYLILDPRSDVLSIRRKRVREVIFW